MVEALVMPDDDVRRAVDLAQRRVQHRQRLRVIAGAELGLDVDDQLPQLLLVRLGFLELRDEARVLALERLQAFVAAHGRRPRGIHAHPARATTAAGTARTTSTTAQAAPRITAASRHAG